MVLHYIASLIRSEKLYLVAIHDVPWQSGALKEAIGNVNFSSEQKLLSSIKYSA